MNVKRLFFALLIALLTVSVAAAHNNEPADLSGVVIRQAWARATAYEPVPEGTLPASTASVYMVIENNGEHNLTLLTATSPIAPEAMLHNMSMDASGVMSMDMFTDGVSIPAGESFAFEQMGPHIMLVEPTRDLYPGDAISVTLSFTDDREHLGELVVGVPVLEFPPEESALSAYNGMLALNEDGETMLSLTLENHGETDADLVEIAAWPPALAQLRDGLTAETLSRADVTVEAGESLTYASLTLPELLMATESQFEVGAAALLELRFDGGVTLNVAVPLPNLMIEAEGGEASGEHNHG